MKTIPTTAMKLVVLALILNLTACASKSERSEFPYTEDQPQQGETNTPHLPTAREIRNDPATAADPVLQPGFVIEMTNIEDRKLNGSFKIEFDGSMHLPYNVVLKTSGLKLVDVKAEMSKAYRKFFKNPSSFNVQLKKRVYLVEVRGLVEKPGVLTIEPHSSLESIISQAGGLSKEVPPKYLRVVHKDQSQLALSIVDYFKAGSQFAGLQIKAGDTLYFQVDTPEGGASMMNLTTIQIMGEVLKPGSLTYQPGHDLYDYLLQAGGPAPLADLSHIRIIRGPSQNRLIADMDLIEEEKRPVVHPGDLILVPYDKATPFEKKLTQTASIATIISAVALILFTFGVR